jgi:hypothetical protein
MSKPKRSPEIRLLTLINMNIALNLKDNLGFLNENVHGLNDSLLFFSFDKTVYFRAKHPSAVPWV